MRISDWSSDVCSSDLRASVSRGGAGSVVGGLAQNIFLPMTELALTPAERRRSLAIAIACTSVVGTIMGLSWPLLEIGRASCRERVCQYEEISRVAVS